MLLHGIIRRDIELLVLQPPKITGDQFNFLEKNVDNSVLLECNAYGFPKPEIRWLKDGEPITLSERVRYLSRLQSLIIGMLFQFPF